ncbi:Uncharacterised protein [Shewanella baltica]|nr:Uncharacterised protein [Shewanella baltica]
MLGKAILIDEADCSFMSQKCFGSLEQSKIPSPVVLQIFIYLANVGPSVK